MPNYELLQLGHKATWVLFVFAFGACCGSLINVLVYRLPLELGVVTPPSRCPACDTRLTWRENIPVLGWVFLGGKCRFCKSKISAEYPLVELFTGLLLAGVFALWYLVPERTFWLGVDWGAFRPAWALSDSWEGWPRQTWPIAIVYFMLLASLVAMTLVDAKTYTIPLVLPYFAAIVGIVFHTGGAVLVEFGSGHLRTTAPGWVWAIPTPGGSDVRGSSCWWWIGASLGGITGLVLSNVFLKFGLLRQSFADYAEWEERALRESGHAGPGSNPTDEPAPTSGGEYLVGQHAGEGVGTVLRFAMGWIGFMVLCTLAGAWIGPVVEIKPWIGLAVGFAVGPIVGALAAWPRSSGKAKPDTSPVASDAGPSAPEMWIQYPHARREMLREILFITPCIGLGWLGGWAMAHLTGHLAPLWLVVLAGTLMGYLIGGGVIWGIRIGGSLGFGKEAMGLGDVHMMAAVGACTGWIDAALAVMLGSVVGLYIFIGAIVANRPAGRAMQFGPPLAIATVLIIIGKPLVELGLNLLIRSGGGGGVAGDGVPRIHLP